MEKDFGIEREGDRFILWIVPSMWDDQNVDAMVLTAEDLHNLGEMVKELEVDHVEGREDPQSR
jgi:hypothetical protein